MGEHSKPFTLRIDADTKEQLVNLQGAFWPFCDDLSSAVRIAIRTSHALIFTPLKLREVFARLQRIQGVTLQDAAQLELNFDAHTHAAPKKPLRRVTEDASEGTLGRRLAFTSVGAAKATYGITPRLGVLRLPKSTRFQGVAA